MFSVKRLQDEQDATDDARFNVSDDGTGVGAGNQESAAAQDGTANED